MEISAGVIKDLREKTGAGMMDCKKALNECAGDMEKAVDYLRAKGLADAKKKQARVAAEGAIATIVEGNVGVMVEVNCETDFVSKGDDFQNFAKRVAKHVYVNRPENLDILKKGLSEVVNELTLKCGEKVEIRRFHIVDAKGGIGSYNHNGKIGVMVDVSATGNTHDGKYQELLKDISMHIAAAAPKFLKESEIDEAFKKREIDVYSAQLREEGKAENMIPKIVEGKLKKMASEVCLLEQKFVKDPDIAIKKHIESVAKEIGGTISVNSFRMLTLGEGIEKKTDNLADEVAKMTMK